MDKKYFILFLSFFLLLAGCKGSDENEVEFQTVVTDKSVVLSNETLSPTCTVHLQLEEATEANGHRGELINATVMKRLLDREEATMKLAADAFAEDYTSTYKTTMLPLYNQDRADTTKRAWYQYHYIIDSSTQKGSKGTVVYLATVDYYEGGAHGINQLLTLNFEAKTGRLLTLSDIFVPGYEQSLKNVLFKALKAKTACGTLTALHEKGYLNSMDIFPSENFILGEETITFVYNPYEIAPYALGSTELIIPFSDIEKLLKNSFLH
ncbi:MAG: DUF3298 domain-containing protein [Prevotella sp.]|nr:DUF3298 domain-containing protein [Prevotella sp.]